MRQVTKLKDEKKTLGNILTSANETAEKEEEHIREQMCIHPRVKFCDENHSSSGRNAGEIIMPGAQRPWVGYWIDECHVVSEYCGAWWYALKLSYVRS
jgi:hypothetical protein